MDEKRRRWEVTFGHEQHHKVYREPTSTHHRLASSDRNFAGRSPVTEERRAEVFMIYRGPEYSDLEPCRPKSGGTASHIERGNEASFAELEL
jgi:hypothetical protein